MSMTENEAKQWLKHTRAYQHKCDNCECIDIKGACNEECKDFYDMAIQALEEIQAYRVIGTVEELKSMKENGAFTGVELAQLAIMQMRLKEYSTIGTIEKFKSLKEKSVAKKPIRSDLCTCPSCGTHNDIIKKRRNTVAFDTVYCWYCGQAIEIKCD